MAGATLFACDDSGSNAVKETNPGTDSGNVTRWKTRRGDAEIQPAAGEVIEHRDAVGEFGRVMIGQQETAGAETDILGLQESLRQQQIR